MKPPQSISIDSIPVPYLCPLLASLKFLVSTYMQVLQGDSPLRMDLNILVLAL
jgi:hypothetical protein